MLRSAFKTTWVAALALCAPLGACGTHVFVFRDDVPGRLVETVEQPYFVYGLSQSRQTDASSLCGDAERVVRVRVTYTLVETLLSVLSANVYYPLRAEVYCAE